MKINYFIKKHMKLKRIEKTINVKNNYIWKQINCNIYIKIKIYIKIT